MYIYLGPSWVADLVRMSFKYLEVVGSIPRSGHIEATNQYISKWNKSTSLSLKSVSKNKIK